MSSSHPLDQALIVAPTSIDEVRDLIEKAALVGMPGMVWMYIREQRQTGLLSAIKTAAAFAIMKEKWETETSPGVFVSDDHFLDEASAETGYSKQTIQKYIDAWQYAILNAPQEHVPLLLGKDMNGLGLIATASKSGLLDKGKWNQLAKAPDTSAIREILKVSATSSGTRLEISIDMKTGQLFRRRGRKPWKPFGMVDINSKDEDTIAAVERVKSGAHAFPR